MKLAKEIRDGVLAEIMGRVGMNELELLRDSSPPVWNGLVCEIDRIISAKLEPVREALQGLVGSCGESPTHDGFEDLLVVGKDIRDGIVALAMLSEEVEDV